MQAIGNDLKVDNGFASGSAPQTVDDSDDDDILENWDDEDAGGRSTRVANCVDDSSDEVFSCSHLVTVCVYFILFLRNLLAVSIAVLESQSTLFFPYIL